MSATTEAPKTIPWGEIPPGSLCRTANGSLLLRWPSLRDDVDACWAPTVVPAGGPRPLWSYWPSASDAHVTLLAATLSDADCDALQCVQDPKVLVALAALLDRVNSSLAQTSLTRWKDIPPDSVAIIVRDETSKPGRAHGDIVWRHDALHAQFVGHIAGVPGKWEITSGNWHCGQVVVLHEKASSIPGLAEMFARKDIAGIAAACATRETLPEQVEAQPEKVGDVDAWIDVQPGTLVRLRDNREVLRWRECDTYGDDTAIVRPGNTC